MSEIFGFGVPLVTLTDDKGEVDPQATRQLWDHMFPLVDVAVILGTTGRGRFILNEDLSQAKAMVDIGIELAGKHGKPLVVGTGAETMERSRDLTEYTAARGAFAVLVTAPIYWSSPFARSLAGSPLALEYQEKLVDEYFLQVLQAIPPGSPTRFLPYIFPTLTENDPRTTLRPEILNRLSEEAVRSGRLMDGGKLTIRDDNVPLEYGQKCPQLQFQAGFDSTVQTYLCDPRLRFNGAILGLGNLIPRFLRAHVYDCLRLKELRSHEQPSAERGPLLRKVLRQQNDVSALLSIFWEGGAFGQLIHAFLGAHAPYQAVRISFEELSAWAPLIAVNAASLVPEITSHCPESPLSRELLRL